MSMSFPGIDERESISYRPGDTFADSFLSIICADNECISGFWVCISSETRRECLLCDRIDTATTESLYSCLFTEIEPEDIEISPYTFHSIILLFRSNSSINNDSFITIFFYKFLRKLDNIFCRCFDSLLEKRSYMITIWTTAHSEFP